jgi:hypothetical protein
MLKQLSSLPCDAFIINHYPTMISRTQDPLVFRPAMYASTSDENLKVDNEGIEKSMDVYARFSPLIEGPAFLPIHVEIMIHSDRHDSSSKNEFMEKRTGVIDGKDTEMKGCEYLYRFDFLPQNPRDPTTIQSLLTFRGVPGKVRFRTLQHCFKKDIKLPTDFSQSNDHLEQTVSFVPKSKIHALLKQKSSLFWNGGNKSKMSFTVPIGRISLENEEEDLKRINKLPSSIPPFIDEFVGKELNLLSSNCYTFAWSLLQTIPLN